jgi:hypothetical protein
MGLRCSIAIFFLAACAGARSTPSTVLGLTVLVKWPATISGVPQSGEVASVAAALPESIAGELASQGLLVARVESEPHDLTATAMLELQQETRIDPFTTRPVKGRYRGVAGLDFLCSDGTAGSIRIDLHDQRLDSVATMAGPPLARAFIGSDKVLACSIRRRREKH